MRNGIGLGAAICAFACGTTQGDPDGLPATDAPDAAVDDAETDASADGDGGAPDVCPALVFSENCYFNATSDVRFNLFVAGGRYGDLGDVYDFAGWRSLGYDCDSIVTDPMLDEDRAPTTPACTDYGWLAP
jgi:hypothetical protein